MADDPTLPGGPFGPGPGRLLTLAQLAELADTTMGTHIVANPGGGADITIGIPYKGSDPNAVKTATITKAEYEQRVIRAIAIMYAESGGWTDARCYDGPVPAGKRTGAGISANCNAPGRGVDRGLFQFNSKAFPNVSDSQADTPATAASIAWSTSVAFSQWGPWSKSKGMDNASDKYQAAKKAYEDRLGIVIDDTPGPGSVSDVTDALAPWADGLAKFLSFITTGSFWLRVGIGALGVVLVVFSVSYLSKSTIVKGLLPT